MYLKNSLLYPLIWLVYLLLPFLEFGEASDICIYDGIPQSLPINCTTLTIQNGNLGALSSVSFSHLTRSTNIQTLTLSDNGITEIGRDAMQNFPALEQLDASENSIVSLDSAVFQSLSKLKYLYLQGNKMSSISNSAFEGLDKLEVLRLDDNLLRNIDSSFSGLTNLDSLNLTFNLITEISSDTFDGITRLHNLFLGYNRLTEIPEALKAGSIQKLNILNLRSNKINIRLTSSDLHHDYLKKLYLTNNGIPGLSGDFFDHLRRLQVLHLDYNSLTNVTGLLVQHQQELREIKLAHNLWDCNCNDAQVWEQLDNQKIIDRDDITCDTPSSSKGEVAFDFATSCESGLSPAFIGIIAASAIIFSGLLIPACICCCWKNCQCFHKKKTMNVSSSAHPDREIPPRSRCPTPRNIRPVISDGHTYDLAQQPEFGTDNYLVPMAME